MILKAVNVENADLRVLVQLKVLMVELKNLRGQSDCVIVGRYITTRRFSVRLMAICVQTYPVYAYRSDKGSVDL